MRDYALYKSTHLLIVFQAAVSDRRAGHRGIVGLVLVPGAAGDGGAKLLTKNVYARQTQK